MTRGLAALARVRHGSGDTLASTLQVTSCLSPSCCLHNPDVLQLPLRLWSPVKTEGEFLNPGQFLYYIRSQQTFWVKDHIL